MPCTDPLVLGVATKVLLKLGEAGAVISAYEAAHAAAPDSESLLKSLCLVYARVEDWRKLSSTAVKLYGKHPKPLYMAWAGLASHVLAGQPAAGTREEGLAAVKPAPNPVTGGGKGITTGRLEGKDALQVTVAERFLARALDAVAHPQERDADTLGLYLHSLLRQGKAGEAYSALMGKYAYLPSAPSGSTPQGEEKEAAQAGESEEDMEAAASDSAWLEGLNEDGSAFTTLPDGLAGRGRVPGPLQPGDQLRYAAQILALRAAWGPAAGEATPLPVPEPGKPEWRVCDPTGGAAVGSWEAARNAFAALLTQLDSSAGEWDMHAGLAYCHARLLAAATAAATGGAAVEAALAPVLSADGKSLSSASITGSAAVNTLLAQHTSAHLAAALGTASSSASSSASEGSLNNSRACLLSLLLQQAVRCELAHRVAASPTLVQAGHVAYVRIIAAFVRVFGTRQSAFSDLKTLLTPLCRPGSASAGWEAVPAAVEGLHAPGPVASFLAAEPSLLSLPFLPYAQQGSAAESATASALFAWSFTVPAEVVQSELVAPLLAVWRAACLPNAGLSARVKEVLGAGRAAAVEAGLIDASDITLRTRDIRGGAKSGGSNSYDPRSPPEHDPQGVAWALSARDEYVFTEAHKAVLAEAKAQVRRYTTAMQMLRYVGVTDLLGCSSSSATAAAAAVDQSAAPADAAAVPAGAKAVPGEAALRAVASELAAAWEHTLHLLAASPAESKELGEGDDLLLLCAHALWDLAWAHAHARDVSNGTGSTTAFGGPLSASAPAASEIEESRAHLYASRAYLLESAALLTAAAKHSSQDAQLRLALIRVHAWLAAPSGVLLNAQALKLRYISQETLMHVAYTPFLRAYWTACLPMDKSPHAPGQLVRFTLGAGTERREHVQTALQLGNVASAADLVRMKGRLEHSASAAWARAMTLGYEVNAKWSKAAGTAANSGAALQEVRSVLYSGVNQPETAVFSDDSPLALAQLRDNEDREVMACWAQPSGLTLTEARTGLQPSIRDALCVQEGGADISTAKVVDAALRLFSVGEQDKGAGVANARCELTGWQYGSSGGMAERLLRRGGREIAIQASTQVAKALLYGLRLTAVDGSPAGAKTAVANLARTFALAGCTVPGASLGVQPQGGAAALNVEALSTVAGVYAASCAEAESGAGGGSGELRRALFSDWATGCLPLVDTGLSSEAVHVRVAAAAALWHALAGLAAISEAAVGELKAADKHAAVQAADAHVRIACALGAAMVLELGKTVFEVAPLPAAKASAAGETFPVSTSAFSAWAGASSAVGAPHASITGIPCALPALPKSAHAQPNGAPEGYPTLASTQTGGGLRLGWVTEVALVLQRTLPPLLIALHGVAKHAQVLDKEANTTPSSAGGKAGKGAAAAAAVGTAVAVSGLGPSLSELLSSLRHTCVPSLATACGVLKATVKAVYSCMDGPVEQCIGLGK